LRDAIGQVERAIDSQPAEELDKQVNSVLDHAVDAYQRGLKVYQSLQNLNEVIGTEYCNRVLYELIQNAHDAHPRGDGEGRIAIELIIRSDTEGVLYVANGGSGFRIEDVDAIRNLATSAKEVGEGIGNKGLGFRSIEALTDDVQIFSSKIKGPKDKFDGYCFRFAKIDEIEGLLNSFSVNINVINLSNKKSA
jgi:anti-sigma regulatory factor (Ser/Thr protein kinase)